ncbi:hypothetical protein Tco_0132075 [Tanacetum coccineum]
MSSSSGPDIVRMRYDRMRSAISAVPSFAQLISIRVTYAQVVISFLEICYWTLEVITTSKIGARGHHPYYGIDYPGSIAT